MSTVTNTRECPTCGASRITATDARVCCPVSAATLDALDQLPGAGYYAAERSRCRAWLAAGAQQHDAAVAKIEALNASEGEIEQRRAASNPEVRCVECGAAVRIYNGRCPCCMAVAS
jgi:ferric-dicitrate binding protein FerR (iron transport regulator)